MDHADHMAGAVALVVGAIRGADPARFDDPTPCAEYTVRALVDHIASGMQLALDAARRAQREWSDGPSPVLAGLPEDEWARACATTGAAVAAAWADPTAWEGESTMATTPMPAGMIGSLMTAEFAVHAWDVAVATGQRLDVPPALGEAVLAATLGVAQMGRDGGWYGPEVPVAADAAAFERALGASGRDPGWISPA
jgi:uncharacterized protein (TIGR03086 family)